MGRSVLVRLLSRHGQECSFTESTWAGVFWFGVDDASFSVHIPFYAVCDSSKHNK